MSGIVTEKYLDGPSVFTTEQMQFRLPNRHALVQQHARSEQTEPWFEDSALPFDLVSTWISEAFRGCAHYLLSAPPLAATDEACHVTDSVQPTEHMTDFARAFYSTSPVNIISSDEERSSFVQHIFISRFILHIYKYIYI